MSDRARVPPAPTHWLAVPSPIATLFKRVPLAVYPANDLPLRSPSSDRTRTVPILYIFTTNSDAARGRPSFNPSCLKWQTILRIARVPFTTAPSTNHASPTGALPFLLPPPSSSSIQSEGFPIPAGEPLLNHATSNASPANILDDTLTPRQEAYLALLTTRVRPALLHALYVNPANTPLLRSLYIDPASQNALVRATLLRQVRRAAEAEVLGTTRRAFVDADALYDEAAAALAALETTLVQAHEDAAAGAREGYFSGTDEAALFDAEVFAYTNIILDEGLAWLDSRLRDVLHRFPALVAHRQRMLSAYFPEGSTKSLDY